ncbi:MAG: hypothetical protein CVU56_19020 [Deltaproteobacteria bacterium HGW-Deltaproteobacteria-14]|jgi:hypothetical protein|nr:MAG: hypothetical protein CVU56_19020 [Deltaproteobacteria bacterium HGW-Deltaproteobacteria-14]
MITAALLVGIAACLVLVTLLIGARGALRARAARRLERDLGGFLRDVRVSDHEHATGSFDGLPVSVAVGHGAVVADVVLPHAILPYNELVERYASDALQQGLVAAAARVEANDHARLTLVREADLSDTLGTLAKRLAVVREVGELRRFAPAELLTRVPRLRTAAEVDAALDAMVRVFPDAPETRQAYSAAVERYQDGRLAARAAEQLGLELAVHGH